MKTFVTFLTAALILCAFSTLSFADRSVDKNLTQQNSDILLATEDCNESNLDGVVERISADEFIVTAQHSPWWVKYSPEIDKQGWMLVLMILHKNLTDEEVLAIHGIRKMASGPRPLIEYSMLYIYKDKSGKTRCRKADIPEDRINTELGLAWKIVSKAKYDTQATRMGLDANDTWYLFGRDIDANSIPRSSLQVGLAYNPPENDTLVSLKKRLIKVLEENVILDRGGGDKGKTLPEAKRSTPK